MGTRDDLLDALEDAPPAVLEGVLRYVRFLKTHRSGEGLEPALLSESVLAKDWSRPEEDAAWAHL